MVVVTKKPRKLWANGVNLTGLIFSIPLRVVWKSSTKSWWTEDGNFEVERMGLHVISHGITTYSAKDRELVEAWTAGARSVMAMIRNWSTPPEFREVMSLIQESDLEQGD